jgi:hypothetical protein
MKSVIGYFLVSGLLCSCFSNDSSNNIPPNDIIPIKTANKLWIGKWVREQWQNDATLEISNIKSDSIEFSLFAGSGGHTGEIAGMAVVRDSIATFINSEETDTCLIEFILIGDSVIRIKQKRGNCFTALAVTYDGYYKNSKKISIKGNEEDLVTLGILKTREQDSLFRALVGESYSLFVNSTQLTSEDDDLDSLNITVRSSGVRGLYTFMENIIMIDSSNNIWAAVIDDNKVYYFTTKKEYTEQLPKTIDNWRQNFKNYPIVYK